MRARTISLAVAICFLFSSVFLLMQEEGDAGHQGLILEEISFDTTIVDHYAVTEVSALFDNPTVNAVELVFGLEIPEGSMMSNLSVTTNGTTYYAEVAPKEQAQEEYEEAVEQGESASQVSGSSDPNRFTLSVNVAKGAEMEVRLRYEQILTKVLGEYEFEQGLSGITDYTDFRQVTSTISMRGMGNILSLEMNESTVDPLPSVTWNGSRSVEIEYGPEDPQENDMVHMVFTERAPPVNGTMRTYVEGDEGYFIHLFSPQIGDLGNFLPKDIIFVLDRSGSMMGDKIEQLKDAFDGIVHQLYDVDRFNVIMFSSDTEFYQQELIAADEGSKDAATQFINTIQAAGSTNIDKAISDAMMQFEHASASVPIVVFLTDGNPTMGVTNPHTIRENVKGYNTADASLYSLGFGSDVDFEFLRALSLENGGLAYKIPVGEDASDMMRNFYDTISIPLLRHLYFNYTAGSTDVMPSYMPSLFEGSEAAVSGRFDPSNDYVTSVVTAQSENGTRVFEETFEVDRSNDNDYVMRLWAHRKILTLLDQITVEGETEELVNETISIALDYSFITPYTSFILVVEEQEDEGTQEGSEEDDPLEQQGNTSVPGFTPRDQDGTGDYDGDGTDDQNSAQPVGDDTESWAGDDDTGEDSGPEDDLGGSKTDEEKDEDESLGVDEDASSVFMILSILGVLFLVMIIAGALIYSRIAREELLKQENRKKIYDHIMNNPGDHFRSIQRAVGLEIGVLSHHMNVLEKEQLIVSQQDGNNRCFWCAGVKHDDNRIKLSRIQENILRSINKEPGITQSQIAKAVGVSRKVVFYHVKFLRNAGMVREEKVRRSPHYYPR